jgi:hypothetical protein
MTVAQDGYVYSMDATVLIVLAAIAVILAILWIAR